MKTIRFLAHCALAVAVESTASEFAFDDSETGVKSTRAIRTPTAPSIDGVLDDDAWQLAEKVEDFHQIVPTDGGLPSERTIVRVLFDDEFLYVAAEMLDSEPSEIRASQLIQGQTFSADDRFWVTVDSFYSRRSDYFFQVNANGIRREGLRENNTTYIEEWDTIWYANAKVNEAGWVAEIAIPFKSISFDPELTTWGINFGRGIMRKQEFMMWSSFERQDWPAYAGNLTGIGGINQGRGIDIVPSLIGSRRADFDSDSTESKLEPSVDAYFRLTPSMTGTLTLNTDFSGTEVDDRQINLDRFNLFVPEKRGFFLQDAGIFEFADLQFNGRPFFSRRIGLTDEGEPINLIAGAKITGRVGRLNLGALTVRQESQRTVPERTLSVARVTTKFFRESSAGFILTNGDPTSGANNTVVGADVNLRSYSLIPDRIVAMSAWLQRSNSTGLSGDDSAYGIRLEYPNDRFAFDLDLKELGENFYPALGFVNRPGIRQANGWTRYRIRPSAGSVRSYDFEASSLYVDDSDGVVLSRALTATPVSINLHSGDAVSLSLVDRFERVESDFLLFGQLLVPAGSYDFRRVRAELSSSNHRQLSGSLTYEYGDFFGGTLNEWIGEAEWRPSKHLFLSLFHSRSDAQLPTGRFAATLTRLRSSIAFDSRWSIGAVFQHDNASDNLGISARLIYRPRAGQEALFVVNHSFDAESLDDHRSLESELVLRLAYTFRY